MLRCWAISGSFALVIVSASGAVAQQTPAQPLTVSPKTAPAAASKTATPAAAHPAKHKKVAHKIKEARPAEPVVQAPPPPPPTPEESPAATPQVAYQNGQLSIRSDNSTLGSILNAVKAQTGATVEGLGSSASDRIAIQLGPGDPRDILNTLLNGSKYDFILLGSPGSPNSVQKIILTARASGGPASPGGMNILNQPGQQTAFRTQGQVPPEPDQELPDAEVPDEANQPEQPAQPEQPEQAPSEQPPTPTDQSQQQGNPNQPKTPEQLLQELQRMQQQQQQQQEQQRQQNLNPQ